MTLLRLCCIFFVVFYFFSKGLDFGGDGDFSEERFENVLNADLANDLGNMLNRCAMKSL